MGCDMVVALPAATGNGQTIFGANTHRPASEAQTLRLVRGRTFAAGETLQTPFVSLPQVRQTCTVLAAGPPGMWGYLQGINDHRLAVACSDWQSRLRRDRPGLLGPDLVRLALERAQSARQAMEVLTDLIVRHGQGLFSGSPEGDAGDHIFLVADAAEAFAVEAAGLAWAAQGIYEVRAAGDIGIIRQDWYRLAPGLADRAIAEGWSASDGCKVDFVGALGESPTGTSSALRRWGRATVLLEQQNGHIDGDFVRRLLADHYDGTRFEVDPLEGLPRVTAVCQHAMDKSGVGSAVSGVAELSADPQQPAVWWVALGPPCINAYFPLVLEGDLPAALSVEPALMWHHVEELRNYLGRDARRWLRAREMLGRLQERFVENVAEFLSEAVQLKQRSELAELHRLATSMMQNHVERFQESVQGLLLSERRTPARMLMVEGVGDF
jgi:secernin